MKEFTPFEYLMISTASAYGLDKLLFEERIEWVKEHGKNLRNMVQDAEDKPLFMRAVLEIERMLGGATRTNYMMGMDACASGQQILAALSNCHVAAEHVGMVDPNKRCDVYTALQHIMNEYLPVERHIGINPEGYSRSDLKYPYMTHFYYSKEVPKQTFGEGSVELLAFYKAVEKMAPGPSELMEDMAGSIEEGRLEYRWVMPDGFDVRTKVMVKQDKKVEVQELPTAGGNASTFTHRITVNAPSNSYVAVPANITHSCDSLVVREMHRMCNHDKGKLLKVRARLDGCRITDRSKFVSLREVNQILSGKTNYTDNDLGLLAETIDLVMERPSFPLVTIHDEFKASPVNMNHVRQYYIDIFARMADSNMCQDILRQVYQMPTLKYHKVGSGLSEKIRGSNYMLA